MRINKTAFFFIIIFGCLGLLGTITGCGGGGGSGGTSSSGGSPPVQPLGYTLTGKIVLPDGSSGPGILVLASKVDEDGVSSKQAKVLAAQPAVKTSFNQAVSMTSAESTPGSYAAGTYATVTDSNGIYILTGLDTGTYYIEASRDGLKAKGRGTVSPLEATVVDMALTPTGSITGYCVLDNRSTGSHSGTFVIIKGTDYIGFTDDDGSFSISQVPVGNYQVSFMHPGYRNADYPSLVTVPAAAAAALDITTLYSLEGGTIIGTVTAQDELPLGGVMIRTEEDSYFAETTDDGTYRLDGLEPGEYTVGFKHDLIDEGYLSDPLQVEEGCQYTVDAGLRDLNAPVWEGAPGVVYVTEIDAASYGQTTPAVDTITVAVEFGRCADASAPVTYVIYHNTVEQWDPENWDNNIKVEFPVAATYQGIRGEQGVVLEELPVTGRFIFGVRVKDRHGKMEYNRGEYLFVAGDGGTTAQERDNLLTAVGNIGIGTKDPQGLLHVESESGSAFVVDEQSGNVGIGTTDPHAALTVGSVDQQQTQPGSSGGTFAVDSSGSVISGAWQGDAIADDYIQAVSGSKIVGAIPSTQITGDIPSTQIVGAIPSTQISGDIPGSQVTGDITGNAANVTGTVAVENGGTGAATTTAARSNLGLGTLSVLDSVSGGAAGTIDDGSITAADMAAGTVTDAEISVTAAIAGTKISPDFGHQNIITMGKVGISTADPKADLHVVGAVIMGPALGTTAEAGMVQFDGTGFKGYDGLSWKSLDTATVAQGDLAVDDLSDNILSDLSNVDGSTPATDQVLKWNGTAWAPSVDADTDTYLSDSDIGAFGYIKTDNDTTLTDSEIGAMGYIKDYTETDPTVDLAKLKSLVTDDFHNLGGTDLDTKLSDAEISAMGYIKTDTDTTLTDSDIATMGYLKSEADPTVNLAKLKSLVTDDFHNLGGTDADTTLSDTDIAAMGYIKTDTDTTLTDNDIATMGYIKTDNDTTYTAGANITFDSTTINAAADGHSLDAADGGPANIVTVNAAGNVGIGVPSAGASLEVAGPVFIAASGVTFEIYENVKVTAGGTTITHAIVAAGTGKGTAGSSIQGVFAKAFYNGTSTVTDFALMPLASGLFGQASTGSFESPNNSIAANAVGVSGSATGTQLGSNTGVIGTVRGGAHRNIGVLSLANLSDVDIVAAYTALPAGFTAGLYVNNSLTGNNDFSVYSPSAGKSYFAGSVGIGSSAPGYKLDVAGTVRATNFIGDGSGLTGLGSAGGVINEGSTTVGADDHGVDPPDGTGEVVLQTRKVTRLIVANDGSVGIGTTTPGAMLDVQGAAQFGTGNVALIDATGKIAGISATNFASLDGSALTALNATNLASGTVDNTLLDEDLQDLADGQLTAAKVEHGALFITTPGTDGQVWKSDGDGAGVWGPDAVNDAVDGTELDGVFSTTGLLSRTGTGTYATVSPDTFVAVAGDTMTGSLTLPANGLVAGTNQLVLAGGNVGIGTTNPLNKLQVEFSGDYGITVKSTDSNSSIGLDAGGVGAFSSNLQFANAGALKWSLRNSNVTNMLGVYSYPNNNFPLKITSSTVENTMVLNSGKVGIGTADPGQNLEVVGSAAGAMTTPLLLRNIATASVGNGVGIRFGATGSANATVAQAVISSYLADSPNGDGNLVFSTFNETTGMVDRLIIDHSGKVGVGTMSPASLLTVGGTVEITGAGLKFSDGSLQPKAAFGDGHSLDADDGDPVDSVYVNQLGAVGIGTDDPQDTLDVNGHISLKGRYLQIYAGYDSNTEYSHNGIKFNCQWDGTQDIYTHNGPAAIIAFNKDANRDGEISFSTFASGTAGSALGTAAKVTLKNNGNVGIGTTSPGAKLDVVGTVKATAFSGPLDPGFTAGSVVFQGGSGLAQDNGSLFWDDNNNRLGIGTTSPAGIVHLVRSGTPVVTVESTATSGTMAHLKLKGARTGADAALAKFEIFNNESADDDGANAVIQVLKGANVDSAAIDFQTRSATALALVSALFIEETGKIGIGTTGPGDRIDVVHGENVYIRAHTIGDNDAGFHLKASSVGDEAGGINQYAMFIQGANNSGDLRINEDYINGAWGPTARLTIKNDTGKIGIGTTDPVTKLEVAGTVTATGFAGPLDPGFTAGSVIFQGGSGLAQDNANLFWDNTDNRLGIGTTAPESLLQVHNTSAGADTYFTGSEIVYKKADNSSSYLDKMDTGDLVFRMGAGFSEVMRLTNAGSLGIGTSAPAADLHVKGIGGLRISSAVAGPSLVFYDEDDDDLFKLRHHREEDRFEIKNAAGTDLMVITKAGKVGIGTTGPMVKLAVNGQVRAAPGTPSGNQNVHGFTFRSPGDQDGGMFSDADNTLLFATNGITRMAIKAGNVGIGTTDPSTLLDVNGTATFAALGITTEIKSDTINEQTADAGVTVDGVLMKDQIAKVKELRLQNGGSTVWDMFITSGDQSFAISDSNDDANPNLVINKMNGHVGIGTTAPAALLDIRGDAYFDDGDSTSIDIKSATAETQIFAHSNGKSYFQHQGDLGFTTIGNVSNPRMYITSDGKVGIGTTDPTSALQIGGSANVTQTLTVKATNETDTEFGTANLILWGRRTGTTEPANIYFKNYYNVSNPTIDIAKITADFKSGNEGGQLDFYTADTAKALQKRMTITTGGKVGIGTDAPAAKLEVLSSGNETDMLNLVHSGGSQVLVGFGQGGAGNPNLNFYQADGTQTIKLASAGDVYFDTGGNVGIGTTAPANGLIHAKVTTTIGPWGSQDFANTVLRLQDSTTNMYLDGNTIYSDGSMNVGTTSYSNLELGTNNVARLTITGNGKVGIGTTAPVGDLEIARSSHQFLRLQSTATDTGEDCVVDLHCKFTAETLQLTVGKANPYTILSTQGHRAPHSTHLWSANAKTLTAYNGNVGIGTTAPAAPLHVVGTSASGAHGLIVDGDGGGAGMSPSRSGPILPSHRSPTPISSSSSWATVTLVLAPLLRHHVCM